jgi:MoaA/NifB/PqqE/SkfB family radical SAM enzyme
MYSIQNVVLIVQSTKPMKKKLLIEIVMTNQCNKRCPYCKLDFKNKSISKENIDAFIMFLKENSQKVEYFLINFF